MRLKLYKYPKSVGWLGWLENAMGICIGFVHLDGRIIFEW